MDLPLSNISPQKFSNVQNSPPVAPAPKQVHNEAFQDLNHSVEITNHQASPLEELDGTDIPEESIRRDDKLGKLVDFAYQSTATPPMPNFNAYI